MISSSSSAYNLFFLLLPTEDAFPLLVLLVPCFSEAAREQHFLSFLLLVEVGLAAELKICSASDLVFSSSPSSQHNSSLGKAQALLDR